MGAEKLCYKMGDVEAKALIYTRADTVTHGNPLVDMETDAMGHTLAAILSKEVIQILCNEVFDVEAKALIETLPDMIANSETFWPVTKRCEDPSIGRHASRH